MKIRLLMAILPLTIPAFASPFPDPVLPAGVGVNIHFVQGHEQDLDMIAAAGFKFVRIDLNWSGIERVKGSYDWSAYDELTTNLEERGICPYYILDYSNPLYEEKVAGTNPAAHRSGNQTVAPPQHPESIAAFARWAAATVGHYQGRGIVWEIWNEPNGAFWKPAPDVGQYTTLALATCQAIRKADPQAIIVAPASVRFPWHYFETFFKSGVLAYLDGVSVHPYRSGPPESVGGDYRQLRELIARYAPQGKDIPIISGEWGYSAYNNVLHQTPDDNSVSIQTQADFIARQQLFNLFSGVPVSIWYDWKNDGKDGSNIHQNRGTVTSDLKPKPAYAAIQTLTRELSGYRISERYGGGNKSDFVLVLTNVAGAVKLAAWTVDQPHPARLALSPPGSIKTFSWIDGNGDHGTLEINGDNSTCELSGTPKYIMLGTVHLKDAFSQRQP